MTDSSLILVNVIFDLLRVDRNIEEELVKKIERLASDYPAQERKLREAEDLTLAPEFPAALAEDYETQGDGLSTISIPSAHYPSPPRRTLSRSPSPSQPAKRRATTRSSRFEHAKQIVHRMSDSSEDAAFIAAQFYYGVVTMILTPAVIKTPMDSKEDDVREHVRTDPKYLDPDEWKLPADFILFRTERKSLYYEARYRPAGLDFRFDERPTTVPIKFNLSFDEASIYETISQLFRVYHCHEMTDKRYREYTMKVYYMKSSQDPEKFLFYGISIPLNLLRSILQDAEELR